MRDELKACRVFLENILMHVENSDAITGDQARWKLRVVEHLVCAALECQLDPAE